MTRKKQAKIMAKKIRKDFSLDFGQAHRLSKILVRERLSPSIAERLTFPVKVQSNGCIGDLQEYFLEIQNVKGETITISETEFSVFPR